MSRKPIGWRNEPGRHSLAAKGIKTATELSPRDESRLRYAFDGSIDPKRLRSLIGNAVESEPEYDLGETPEGQARFLVDLLSSFNGGGLYDISEDDLKRGGLEYKYESDPPRIVIHINDVEWFDSRKDRVGAWDFTVMVTGVLHAAIENKLREDLAGESEPFDDRKDRWKISTD